MPLIEMGGRCVASALGRSDPLPRPFDPHSLGSGRADAVLAEAGYETISPHNDVRPLRLTLGPAGAGDTHWTCLLTVAAKPYHSLSATGCYKEPMSLSYLS